MIVCLCGSTRFKAEFEAANRVATMSGSIVVGPGVFCHADGISLTEKEKADLDSLHFRKIEMSDVVWVIAPENYVGESTAREIAHAGKLGKRIEFLTLKVS